MPPKPAALVEDPSPVDRHARILDAAERCFIRAGFHRTTMQDVAAEAGMSPGNLYRYFAAKDAIVAALTERDRAEVVAGFREVEGAGDLASGLAALLQCHFADDARDKAVLCLEIWAESTRHPTLAGMTREFDRDVQERLIGLFRLAKERGACAPQVDPEAVARFLATLANGMFVRRAISADFDPDREIAQVVALIDDALTGRLPLVSGKSRPADPANDALPSPEGSR